MADTSLWPVVVGGLLTGLFTIGGIGAGFVASARRDSAQERREARNRRADKFEELVAAVYEFDHWLEGIRNRDAFGRVSVPQTASPFAKVQSISSVYFPQFVEPIGELNMASTQYRIWIYEAESKRISNNTAQVSDGFNEVSTPYVQKRETLLNALQKFARSEFQ
jgi:hypothetical protein